tara:strand:+ start:7664 stop:8569 length:906 start_codon:yes stop_codon:yes gene_type:complete
MDTGKSRTPEFLFILVSLLLAISACSGDGNSNNDASDADRANVDAMSKEHANDSGVASEAAKISPAKPVISQTMAYTEYKDELVYGYFSAPADMFEPLPAVIMIHEWWGLNDNVRAMADRLAGEGYIVFAVDLFGGKTATTPAAARVLMLEAIEDVESGRANIQAAFEFVKNTAGAPKVGSLGWCFGGGWSLTTAQLFPNDLDAAVIYYGQVTDDEELLRPVNAPILGLFAAEDTGIKVETVTAFRDTLQRLRKEHIVHIYPGVGHAFANPTGRRYDAAAASDAWVRTLDFLQEHLSVNGS